MHQIPIFVNLHVPHQWSQCIPGNSHHPAMIYESLSIVVKMWKFVVFYSSVSYEWTAFIFTSSGGAGAVDTERRPDPGEQRPELPAAEDSFWTDPLLPHPADLPLHLREQKDGHHRQGVELVYNNMMCGCCFLCDVFVIQSCSFRVSVSVYYIIECRRLESLSDLSFM